MIHPPHPPHRKHAERDDDPAPGLLPVEPDEGVVPPMIPDDPEHDRTIDPAIGSGRE